MVLVKAWIDVVVIAMGKEEEIVLLVVLANGANAVATLVMMVMVEECKSIS